MTTIENLLEKLEGVEVHTAGTGTIYVYHNGLKVRISDHERNYGAPNRGVDKCFYTQDACGTKFDIYNIVEQVAEYLNIEIKGPLKGMMTRKFNQEMKTAEKLYQYKVTEEQERAELQAKREIESNKLKVVITTNKSEVENILFEAEEYGDLASNGKKRRERTRKYFKRVFVERFGFDPIFSEVKKMLENK